MFNHLSLRRWPFSVVPEPAHCDFIADRTSFRGDVERLLRNLSRQNSSSIHPIWSWFGAGKTHTLYYLSNRVAEINQSPISHLQPIYSEFPRNPRSFVDVYKSFSLQLTRDTLTDAYLEICTSSESARLERDLAAISSDLVNAMKVLVYGAPPDQETTMRWLRAEPLPISDCRRLGISKRIVASEDSSRTLIGLIRMFALCASSQQKVNSRLIWLVDELQRIDRLPTRIRDEINTGLHSTFNACPTGFTMILSFSGHPSETLPHWFSPELKDRIGRARVLILPPMETDDALEFIKDVLTHSRHSEDTNVDPFFPFTEKSCRTIIEDIQENDELKPRAIMQAFNSVLMEADPRIEDKEISTITPDFAKKVLSELGHFE